MQAPANQNFLTEVFSDLTTAISAQPQLMNQRYVKKALDKLYKGNNKVIKAVNATFYHKKSLKSKFFKIQMHQALGHEAGRSYSSDAESTRSDGVGNFKPKSELFSTTKPTPPSNPTGKPTTPPTTNPKSANTTRTTTPSGKKPLNIVSKLETALDIGTPTVQPGSSPTNQVPEEVSALTTYSYNMDMSHCHGDKYAALKQVANVNQNNISIDIDSQIRAFKSLHSNMDKILKVRDKKYDNLDERMETLTKMFTQTIETQECKFGELRKAIISSKSQSSRASNSFKSHSSLALNSLELKSQCGPSHCSNAYQSQYSKDNYQTPNTPQAPG